MPTTGLETQLLSSLEKVFPDQASAGPAWERGTALRDEVYSFQVAYRWTASSRALRFVRVRAESELAGRVTVRSVGLVPSELPIYADHDGDVLRASPGLYPDPLLPVDAAEGLVAPPGQWRAVWITVDLGGFAGAGVYPIRIRFEDEAGRELAVETFELDVIPAALPEQKLIHTEWLHADCLSVHYGVEPLSEAHWALLEKYVRAAASHGINMILTPLFTPPLDTKVGGERPTVQLVEVKASGGTYTFGFDRLRRWIGMCERAGVRYFEFSHLFTQWGAAHAPKIVAEQDGRAVKLFGWETDAAGAEYERFLDQLLPALTAFLKERDIAGRSYFHLSDEPGLAHLESYRAAGMRLRKHLDGFPIMDALSNVEFYERGYVKQPIPASDHLEPFLDAGVPELWTYYCCSQYKDVSNRFFCFPSARNRIIGVQLYKFAVAGFLHWGYNFWFSQYSVSAIDPFRVTDAGCAFPSGDAFVVYPGPDGPIESIRLEVFYEALQDLRALQLLESFIGRERTLRLLEDGLGEPITFKRYPREAKWLLGLRERINAAIRQRVEK